MDGLLVLLFLVAAAIPLSIIILFIGHFRLRRRMTELEGALRRAEALGIPARAAPDKEAGGDPVAMPASVAVAPEEAGAAEDLATAAMTSAESAEAALDDLTATEPVGMVDPWSGKRVAAAPVERAPDKGQDQPLVMRADRFNDLAAWLSKNWVYAISALSLALAGVFFVQYGMENGLLPPGARVLAGIAFGVALIVVGEVVRRRHGDGEESSTAYLPSVFSGAGLVSVFAAIVAARQLYGLIGPQTAFAGLVLTAGVAVVLGWFHGPLLVAVGLVGAASAPFIVDGGGVAEPWLYGYFGLIAATGLAVDAVRRWAWVSALALVLGYFGGWLVLMGGAGTAGALVLALGLTVLAIVVPARQLVPQHPAPCVVQALRVNGVGGWPEFPVRVAAGAVVATVVCLTLAQGTAAEALLAFAGLAFLAVALLIWAERAEGLADLAVFPAAGFVLRLFLEATSYAPLSQEFFARAVASRPPESAPSWVASGLLAMAVVISLAAAYRALKPGPLGIAYGLGAVLTAPVAAATLELFWVPGLVLGNYVWALHLLALAGLMTALALRFAAMDGEDRRRVAHATLSTLSLIALALFLVTTKTALTLALGVLLVVAAALDRRFRLPEMGLFLQIGAAVLGYRLLVDPGLGFALEAPLGQVLLAFGGVIAAVLAALWLIQPLERPMAKGVLESAAAGFGAILANVLITRWLLPVGGAPDLDRIDSHWGVTLNALPWLVLMLMQIYRARLGGPLKRLRQGIALLAGVFAFGGLAVAAVPMNPLFSWGPEQTSGLVRGPLVFDTLALAYLVPGLILLAAALRLPGMPRRLGWAFAAVGAGLAALYAGLEIRRYWQGDWLGVPGVKQEELYSYTLALMLLGAVLLYQAIAKRSDTLRRVAMAVIAVTVAKVFLVDASGLTGLTRVLSFAGLGLSLAGLAWLNRWAGQAAKDAD